MQLGSVRFRSFFQSSELDLQTLLSAAAATVSDAPDIAEPVNESPCFSQLKGAINDCTLQAVTKEPFHHTCMLVVQAKVFPLLPQLAEPYRPNSQNSQPHNLLIKARMGTGKTMAFLVPEIDCHHSQFVLLYSALSGSLRLQIFE